MCSMLTVCCLFALSGCAQAQVNPRALDRAMVGPRAQVLVLGSVHLNGMPPSFNPASLDGVIDRLAAFRPDIVTIETENGETCDLAARHPAKYGADYCASTGAAMAATGLDMPAAIAEVDKTLRAWTAQATPGQRRRLAALFMAASDHASAYVQWLQLPGDERRAGDSLNPALVEALGKIAERNDESYQIAARLAAHRCTRHQGVRPLDRGGVGGGRCGVERAPETGEGPVASSRPAAAVPRHQ